MVDKTLDDILTENPVTAANTGDEPIETVKSGVSEAFKLSQLSAAPVIQKTVSANLLESDQGKAVHMDSSSATVYTVKLEATTAIAIGATFLVRRMGTGSVTIAADGGVTVLQKATATLVLGERYSQIVLQKIGADLWHTTGEYAPV